MLRRCNETIRYIPHRSILGAGISEIRSFIIVESCETHRLPDVEDVRMLNFVKIPILVSFLVNTCR
jgi:hypothetical protein